MLLFWGGCPWNWCTIFSFLDSLTFKIWKKCVTNIINVLDIILKKCRTWTLKHSCKGPNDSFFDFVLLFWDGCLWNWCMIYFFLFFAFKLWKKFVTNIINMLDIILKKCRAWTLKHSCKGPNHKFFFYFVLLFWGGCPWNWCTIYFFWIL